MTVDQGTVHRKVRTLMTYADSWVLPPQVWAEVLPLVGTLVRSLEAGDLRRALTEVHALEDAVPCWRVSESALEEEPPQQAPAKFRELHRILLASIGQDLPQEPDANGR